MSNKVGPMPGLCLCKTDCVEHWHSIVGSQDVVDDMEAGRASANSIPELFGEELQSTTPPQEDVNEFFEKLIQDPIFNVSEVRKYLEKTVIPILLPALEQLSIQRPSNPVMWLADWLTLNNPNQATPEPIIEVQNN